MPGLGVNVGVGQPWVGDSIARIHSVVANGPQLIVNTTRRVTLANIGAFSLGDTDNGGGVYYATSLDSGDGTTSLKFTIDPPAPLGATMFLDNAGAFVITGTNDAIPDEVGFPVTNLTAWLTIVSVTLNASILTIVFRVPTDFVGLVSDFYVVNATTGDEYDPTEFDGETNGTQTLVFAVSGSATALDELSLVVEEPAAFIDAVSEVGFESVGDAFPVTNLTP